MKNNFLHLTKMHEYDICIPKIPPIGVIYGEARNFPSMFKNAKYLVSTYKQYLSYIHNIISEECSTNLIPS